MEKNMIRLLRPSEIECRVSTINEKGLSLLLYKDARVDQRILDETFGPLGWKRSHQCIDGNLYCTVEIYDEKSGTWVAKQDVGTTGFAEKEKAQASDSFKRACFNWGIGRELYTAPFIWIPAEKTNIQTKIDNQSKKERFYCNDHFSIKSINYNEEREITALYIINSKGRVVYALNGKMTDTEVDNKSHISEADNKGYISNEDMELLQAELRRTGVGMETVAERYKIKEPTSMSPELYSKVMKALSKTKTVVA